MQGTIRCVWTALLLQIVFLVGLSGWSIQGNTLLLQASALSPAPSPSAGITLNPTPAPAPSTVATNSSEAAALRILRYDLGIPSRLWPRGTDPCSTWAGIQCEDGHVVAIQLSGLRRTSSKASQPVFGLDALQRFPSLRILNASGFPLPGSIPDWFGGLAKLQSIDFSSVSINGSIPSSLGELSNLRTFIVAHNFITGVIPQTVRNLTNLTVLDLSFNGLTGRIPETISSLRNLNTLSLSANQLTGNIPAGLGSLEKLTALVLANNSFSGSIPSQLGNLSLLRILDLGLNNLLGPIPVEIGKLAFLNTLILSNNHLTRSLPAEVTNCTDLQVLSLDHNSLNGTLPPRIGALTNLSTLNLSYNNLTGILPVGLSSLVQAKVIVLSHNLFYGPLPPGLTNLPNVTQLDLSYNYLNGSLSTPLLREPGFRENCFSGALNQRTNDTCENFYSRQGLPFQGNITSPPKEAGNTRKKGNNLGAILGGVFGGLGLVFIIIVLVLFILKQERRKESVERDTVSVSRKSGSQSITGTISVNLFFLGEKFSFSQLQQATGEFNPSNLLKAGHSGDLYQGLLEAGVPVVVKRIDLSRFKKDAYLAELDLFGKASHTRLVPLLGHCLEQDDEKLLVYKYMPNRDLAYSLHRRSNGSPLEETLQSLDWITRLKIAIGAAEALTYLHHECTPPLVHRDIQASSILLDDKFEVRLGSLTEACVAEGESHHGVIARLFRISQTSEQGESGARVPTCAYDVYCFGKVLLELVSGKLGISGSVDPSADAWIEWALPLINVYDKESVTKIVDPSLIVDEDLLEEVWAMAIVAKSCLNPKPSKRPLMRYILKALENPLKVVREDTLNGSGRSRTSSHGSWNAAFFGSWRHSSSETVVIPGSLREEHLNKNNSKQPGNGGSQGSVQGEVSHRRLGSNEIFPEPLEDSVVQGPNTDSEKQES